MLFAVWNCLELTLPEREQSRSSGIFKIQLHDSAAPKLAPKIFPSVPGENDTLGLDYLPIFAPHPVVLSLGRSHAYPILAADTEIELAKRDGEFARPEPIHNVLHFCPRVENSFPRSIEGSLDNKLAIARRCRRTIKGRHCQILD